MTTASGFAGPVPRNPMDMPMERMPMNANPMGRLGGMNMRRPMQAFQGPIGTIAKRPPTFMNRMRQGMPQMLSRFGEMMQNRGNPQQMQMMQNPSMGGFQRAFSRAMPDQMMPNRRTDMSQFMY